MLLNEARVLAPRSVFSRPVHTYAPATSNAAGDDEIPRGVIYFLLVWACFFFSR